jgi:hypothetical protein
LDLPSENKIEFQNQIPSNGIETYQGAASTSPAFGFKTKFRLTELKHSPSSLLHDRPEEFQNQIPSNGIETAMHSSRSFQDRQWFQNQIPSNGIETSIGTCNAAGRLGFKTKFRLTELKHQLGHAMQQGVWVSKPNSV